MLPRCSATLRRMRSALWADLLRIHWRALRPSKPPSNKKERPNGRSASFARIQREGASAPPAPTPRKYKNKNLAVDGGVGPAFAPECSAVRDRTERPPGRTRSNAACPRLSKICLKPSCRRPTPSDYESGISFPSVFIPRRARLLYVHFSARQSM
jgi:hypothetical protein